MRIRLSLACLGTVASIVAGTASIALPAEPGARFPVVEQGKWGYMDRARKFVRKPTN
jgi:hypothetical protein